VVTSDALARLGHAVRAATIAPLVGACSLALAAPAAADTDVVLHQVTYRVMVDQPTRVSIYYRDVVPPSWAEYSHNPYQSSLRDDVQVSPDAPWVHAVALANPAQWAMVTVTTAGQEGPPSAPVRCELIVDGQTIAQQSGPRGAVCSQRNW